MTNQVADEASALPNLPLVSICVPAHNARATIDASIESAFAQRYSAIEVVVVDDGSTDGTFSRLTRLHDPRLRLFRHRRNRGPNETWNATIIRSRGEYIKFLHDDDLLDPQCVAKMVSALERHPSAGLAFSRRRVIGSEQPFVPGWAERFREPHDALLPLDELNGGRELLRRWWARNEMRRNSLGEPVAIMVRRTALEDVGLFHRHIRQHLDTELWVRILNRSDGVFLDEELMSYRQPTSSSLTTRNLLSKSDWLDRAWVLETAAAARLPAEAHAQAVALLERERRVVLRTCGSMLLRRTRNLPYSPTRAYVWSWVLSCVRRPRPRVRRSNPSWLRTRLGSARAALPAAREARVRRAAEWDHELR